MNTSDLNGNPSARSEFWRNLSDFGRRDRSNVGPNWSKSFLLFLAITCISNGFVIAGKNDAAPPSKVLAIDGGRSPDGQFEVVNVSVPLTDNTGYHYHETHFEIREKSGEVIVSQCSIRDLVFGLDDSPGNHVFGGAFQVLWRPDSHFVAIATETAKFTIHSLVFFKTGHTFKRVEIPDYDDDDDSNWRSEDGVHQIPYAWHKNGDLVLDITYGYTKVAKEDEISEYFATVHFNGNPPRGSKGPQTKVTGEDAK